MRVMVLVLAIYMGQDHRNMPTSMKAIFGHMNHACFFKQGYELYLTVGTVQFANPLPLPAVEEDQCCGNNSAEL